jgi:serine/threonine protein kinase
MTIDDFIVLEDLGRGGFATVKLAKYKKDSKEYAIKCISKETIRGDKQM